LGRELLIVWAGRHQRSHWEEIAQTYRRRIERFLPVRDLPVRARAAPDDPQRMRLEGAALLGALPDPCYVVALDSRGEQATSEALAERLGRLRREWAHPIAFLLGSDLGLDGQVLGAARFRLSLGPMTLSHELARVVLYEQLYRVLSIDAGMSYHREPP
jgi:23S rRNA (pseudouridine1915-N3)-methyltransferase